MPDALALNLELLGQTETAIELLADGFSTPAAGGATPGAHFRHLLDHYQCLLGGLEAGRVDYHERQRDRGTESNPALALAVCRACREELLRATGSRMEEVVHVRTGHDPAERDWAATTVKRELAFCASHTLHHLAIVKMMARERGVDLGEHVGVARSTADHRKGGGAEGQAAALPER